MVEIRVNLRHSQKPGIVFTMPSMTEQNHKAECEINTIIARYKRTGVLPEIFTKFREGQYGDFSKVVDYKQAQDQVLAARESFEQLPASIRRRFDDDVVKLLDFVDDPANYDECVDLGIFPPDRDRELIGSIPSKVSLGDQPKEKSVVGES